MSITGNLGYFHDIMVFMKNSVNNLMTYDDIAILFYV